MLTQAQADSCCAAAEGQNSNQSNPSFVTAITAAVLGVGVVLPANVPALVLSDAWRTSARRYPLRQGLAGVRVVRSQSAFGFSMIYVVFDDDVELYFARTRVLERMSLVTRSLPTGVTPTLGPDATGVGHVFWYTVESPTHSLRELRTLQDWFIRYQLNAVSGVAEVASVGGHVQQYQVDVDPNRLRIYNLPLSAVVSAVRASNLNVGGNVLRRTAPES